MAEESTEELDLTVAPADQPSASRGRVFPLLLTLAAIFPVALGIGFTLQTATPPPATLNAAEQRPRAMPNQIQPHPDQNGLRQLARDRSLGDEQLRAGRYEAALQHYRSLIGANSLRAPADLTLRLALCQEGLGFWDEALATYRSAANSTEAILATSAILGQGRIWIRLNDFAMAEPLLRSVFLQSGDLERVPATMVTEVSLLYAMTLAQTTSGHQQTIRTAGLAPVGNVFDLSLEQALAWIDVKAPELPATADQPPLRILPAEDSPMAEHDVPALDGIQRKDPRVQSLDLLVRQQPVSAILRQIADEFHLKLDWSDEIQERAQGRNVDIVVHGLPLRLVLSAICQEINCQWYYLRPAGTIVIVPNASNTDSRPGSAMEVDLLTDTLSAFPRHRLSGSLKFCLAQLAVARDRIRDGANTYSSLVGRTTSPLTVRAAFNAALAYYQLGDLPLCCQSLEVVIHGAPGSELHMPSLILYGRTLIERGDFREAAFQLKRAAGSRHLPEESARATVFLAMAQWLDGKPHDAAESLFAHRLQFQDRTVRNAASLLTSLARWQTSKGLSKSREAGFLYRAIVAVEADYEWLGPAGLLILGQAMREVDLEDRMAELYTAALERGVPHAIEVPMKLAMADYWDSHNRHADAKSVWTEVYSSQGGDSTAAGLKLAQAALQDRDPARCLEICRSLQSKDHAPRVEIQKLAGKAFDLAGQPVLAAQCYAGQWPLP